MGTLDLRYPSNQKGRVRNIFSLEPFWDIYEITVSVILFSEHQSGVNAWGVVNLTFIIVEDLGGQ